MTTFRQRIEKRFSKGPEIVDTFYDIVKDADLDIDEISIVCVEYLKNVYTIDGIKELFNI